MDDITSAASGKEKILQELITHINSIELKINMLKEEIEEQNDLQTVNRLDIINLKNELEKMKMSLPLVSPDIAENIKNIQKLMEKKDKTSNLEKIIEDTEQIKKQMRSIRPESIDELRNEISALYDIISSQPAMQKPAASNQETKELRERLKEIEKSIKTAEKPVVRCKKCGAALNATAKFCGKCGKKT